VSASGVVRAGRPGGGRESRERGGDLEREHRGWRWRRGSGSNLVPPRSPRPANPPP
jgi:hypothetical protein